MIEFPYMQIVGGISRPIVAVSIEGPSGKHLVDGLLDTGSDPTIFPQDEALALGIPLPPAVDGTIKTAGGVLIPYRLAEAVLELRGSGRSVRWKTSVAFAEGTLSVIHLGMRGFLEHFHATFMGPEKKVVLVPCITLPKA